MNFFLFLIAALLLNASNVYAASTIDPLVFLKRAPVAHRKSLDQDPEKSLANNMKFVLLEAAKKSEDARTAYENMDPATLEIFQTLAAAYICQQHYETRPDSAPSAFLTVWDKIHQSRKPIDFTSYAAQYTRLLYPELSDSTSIASRLAHQFQQQNILNRIKHIAESRIEYNGYLNEKWEALPDEKTRKQFYHDFSGLSLDPKNILRATTRGLMNTTTLDFGVSCEEDKKSYEYFLELISQKKYLLAQVFALQNMCDGSREEIQRKTRQRLAVNEGEENVFLKKIVHYIDLLDFESPILDQEFFGQSVRKFIVDSGKTRNFLKDLNVGLKTYRNHTDKTLQDSCLRAHKFFGDTDLLNAEKFLQLLETLNQNVQRLRHDPTEDTFPAMANMKRVEQSVSQVEVIQSIPPEGGALQNRIISCEAHIKYMLDFFVWAIPIYRDLQQKEKALKGVREAQPAQKLVPAPLLQKQNRSAAVDNKEKRAPAIPVEDNLPNTVTFVEELAPPMVTADKPLGSEPGLVTSDHNNLPLEYWNQEDTETLHVTDFWKKWATQPPMPSPSTEESGQKRAAQQDFAQRFMADKQPDFLSTLNEMRHLFGVHIERSLNGFVKLIFPKIDTLKGFFHVPHPSSDIGRDAMWAREIRRCLTEILWPRT